MNPFLTAPATARKLLAACLLMAGTMGVLAQGLSSDSPFLDGTDKGPAPAAVAEFQLAGISSLAGETAVCIVDSMRKKSTWMKVGDSGDGIEIVSCSLADSQAVVRVRGEIRTLSLRAPAKVTGVQNPQSVATAPVPQTRPALAQNVPAPEALPPDIGPAGGQLPPVIPLTTREEQEREARMLVSDLMEIGMRQRKAYEEAQKAAKAEAAAKGAK